MDFGTRKQKYYTHMAGRHHARQVREQAGLHERKGNVLRGMTNATAAGFMSWLKSTIRRSRRASRRGDKVVDFIPFGVSGLITRDVHAVLCQLRRLNVRGPGLLAAIGAACLLWTDAWVKAVSVPLPTRTYHGDLVLRLLRTRTSGVQVANPSIRACRGRSLLAGSQAHAKRKARRLAALVLGIARRAPVAYGLLQEGEAASAMEALCGPGLPAGGYTAKFMPVLLSQMGLAPWSSVATRGYTGSTGLAALRLLVGRGVTMAGADPALSLLSDTIRAEWTGLPRLPPYELLDLESQLCAWHSAGCTFENSCEYPGMLGALQLQK